MLNCFLVRETMPKLKSKQCKLQSVFNMKMEVPEYQRPASWGADKIERLFWSFSEFVKQSADTHGDVFYLGEIVSQSNSKVVDGQQRLIAFTVICAAIRDSLIMNKDFENASKFQLYLRNTSGRRLFKSFDKEADEAIQKLQNPLVDYYTGYSISGVNGDEITIKTVKKLFQINEKDLLEARKDDGGGDKEFHAPIQFGLNAQGSHKTTILDLGAPLDDSWIGSEIWYRQPDVKPATTDHEIFKAYRRIFSDFSYWFMDLEFECDQKTKTLKEGNNTLKFKMKGTNLGLSPVSLEKGSGLTLKYKNPEGNDESMDVVLSKSTMKHTKLNISFELTAAQAKKVTSLSIKLSRHAIGFDVAKFVRKTNSTTVVLTDFESAGAALEYFTISNNGNNREPLWNFDLLHALVYEIKQSTRLDDDQKNSIEKCWKGIYSTVFNNKLPLKNRKTLSEDFLRRYLLANGVLDAKGSQFKNEDGTVKKFGALLNHWKYNSEYYSPGESWGPEIVKVFEKMSSFCEAVEFCLDPRSENHPAWLKLYDAETKSLLLALRKLKFAIHIPLMAELFIRYSDTAFDGTRNAKMKSLLKFLLQRVLRNFLFKVGSEFLPEGFIPLKGKDIYGLYKLKETGFLDLLAEKGNPNEVVEGVVAAFDNFFERKVEAGGVDHSLNDILQARFNQPFLDENESKGLCFLGALSDPSIEYSLLIKKDKLVDNKLAHDDMEPDIEHILPKTWRAGEEDKTPDTWERWPSFTRNSHEQYVHSPGNMTPLEFKYNRGFGGESLFYKSGVRECPFDGMNRKPNNSYKSSQFLTVKNIVESCKDNGKNLIHIWTVDHITTNCTAVKDNIIAYFSD